ncbi:MAG: ABC transporter ATP-binding protein, partial [Candidatus Aminicenantales bacterium]
MAILEVKELSAGYGNGHVIQNISFSLERGDFLCVLGRNGSGKSTLIRAAQGLLKDRSGSVLVDGLDLSTMSPRDVARKIAYVPQLSYLPFEFCVEEVILMGRYIHQGKLSGITSTDRKVIEDIMDLTQTTALRKKKIAHLSGGERQRVFIARALAQDTPLVFLDEPSAHLDINYQVEIYQILRRLQEEKATTVLVAEHNIN